MLTIELANNTTKIVFKTTPQKKKINPIDLLKGYVKTIEEMI
jgi:hypothetical protein